MVGKRELFISITFSLLAVSHSFCASCSVKKALESQSHQATSTTQTSSNNSSYTSLASTQSENPIESNESHAIASSTPVMEANPTLPVANALLPTLNETIIFVGDESSNFTSTANTNTVENDSSTFGSSTQANPEYAVHPWMKLSRMTREEERGEPEITDSNSIGDLRETDAERVSFVTEDSASAWQPSGEEVSRSDSPESDTIADANQGDKDTENVVESLGSAEDRFGAVYPYLYRQEFLKERMWPIYRKHPYNNYVRYPIFPGK